MKRYLKIFLSLVMAASAMAGVIKPENGKNFRDILIVSGNRSSYYKLDEETLVYNVKGPQRIKIYSRAVLTTKRKTSNPFAYEIQLNGNQPIQVKHKQKYSRGVKSPQHPNHYFSRSAVDYLTIPEGVNQISIRPEKHGVPIVVRVLEESKSPSGKKKRLEALSEEAPCKLLYKGKRLSYYEMTKAHPLFVTVEGPVNLEVISRLGFSPQMGREESYRIQISDNGKLLGTYYFSTDRSESTTVDGRRDVVPGSWRSCDIKLDKGMHEVKFKFLDTDRQVFMKINEIVGD